jgi:hypothetical protein
MKISIGKHTGKLSDTVAHNAFLAVWLPGFLTGVACAFGFWLIIQR